MWLGIEQQGQHARGLGAILGIEHAQVQRALPDRGLQLARRALGDDLAAVDHGDPVGELVGLVEVLRAEQDRGALRDERADDVPDLVARARVEARRRLVEEHELGRDDDARGDIDPPAHAAGVVLHEPTGRVGQPEGVEQLVRPRARLLGPVAEQPAEQDEVLAAGEVVVDRGQLAGQADERPHLVGLADDVVPEHARVAGVRAQERREHADRRRLAGAVGSEHPIDGAARDREVDAVDGAGLPEALDEPGGLDREQGGHGAY